MSGERVWQRATVVLCLLLAAVVGVWHWRVPGASAAIGALLTLPLVLAIPGLAAGRRYTYQWMSLALAVYAGYGVTEAVANPAARTWASAAALLSGLLFITVVGRFRYAR